MVSKGVTVIYILNKSNLKLASHHFVLIILGDKLMPLPSHVLLLKFCFAVFIEFLNIFLLAKKKHIIASQLFKIYVILTQLYINRLFHLYQLSWLRLPLRPHIDEDVSGSASQSSRRKQFLIYKN